MNAGPVAYRYAKALLKYVQETRTGEKVYSQVSVLVLRMHEIRQLSDAVRKHPELSLESKKDILKAALGEPLTQGLDRFISLVHEKGRMDGFERMLYSFVEQYRAASAIKVGTLVTACPVSGLKERLQDLLSERTGATVFLNENIDPDILGGFVLRIDDLKMDASVEGQFRHLRRELVENTSRIV